METKIKRKQKQAKSSLKIYSAEPTTQKNPGRKHLPGLIYST